MAITEINVKYTLTGPDGATAVFNDPSDPNYVGVLTEVTGLDSPEVRESADDLVEMDGGLHGDFYYGRRPITLSGVMLNPSSASERNTRQEKLSRATDAMRGNALLTWTPSGGAQQQIAVRRQQPLRVTGAWQKQFQVALVAADPRVYSSTLRTSTVATTSASSGSAGRPYPKVYPKTYSVAAPLGQLLVTNAGTAATYPIIRVYGPGNNPKVYNFTTGKMVSLIYSLGVGDWLTLDTLNRTVMLNDTTSRYSAVDFVNTAWLSLVPGVNDLRVAYDSYIAGSSMRVDWRDAWL